jgi:hypothetical protein
VNVFQTEREAIAGKLTAAGVAVTLDPRVEAPYVLVELPRVIGAAGIGAWNGELTVRLAAPPPGDADAAAWLLDQLEPVMVALAGATAEPFPTGDLPGYVVTVALSIPNPNC